MSTGHFLCDKAGWIMTKSHSHSKDEGYLFTLAGFSLRGKGHRTLSVVKNEWKTLIQVVSLDLRQRICLSSWRSLALSLNPRNAGVEELWQHPCLRGGAGSCLAVTLESVLGLNGGKWSLDGSVEEGGVLAWGDRNTGEISVGNKKRNKTR